MYLVTGATGTVGHVLVDCLLDEGAQVQAVTRAPATIRPRAGLQVVGADLNFPETVADALQGVRGVFLNPAAVSGSAAKLLELAGEHGVSQVVMLSAAAVRDGAVEQTGALASWHARIEKTVVASGLEWTILRPGEFATNLVQQWGPQLRYGNIVRGAYAESTAAVVHERDIAEVAGRALLSSQHRGATYLLTGPQSLTRAQMVAILAQVLGRAVRFEEVPREQELAALTGRGLPQPIAETVLNLREQSVGQEAFVSPAVKQVTGRPALSFARWVADHAADFA